MARRREEYVAPHTLLPEMPHLGWSHPRSALAASLEEHAHLDCWEICWVVRGSVEWWAGDAQFVVPPSHLYLTWPNEPHGAVHRMLEPAEIFWVNLRADTPALRPLLDHLNQAPRVIAAPRALTDRWWDLLRQLRPPLQPMAAESARAALQLLLIEVTRAAAAATRPTTSTLSPAIAKAQALVRDHLDQQPDVAAMARAAGLGNSQFHARFIAETGESPAEWARRVHLDEAKKRLASTTQSITDIALDLGFPSSQYFATVFKRTVGTTPRAYRARLRTTSSP